MAESRSPSSREASKVDWKKLKNDFCIWIWSPWHMFIAFLCFMVVFSGACVFMPMVGMVQMNDDFKVVWVEVHSQILNAIFTFAALVNMPYRIAYTYDYFYNPTSARLAARIPWIRPTHMRAVGWNLFLWNCNWLTQYGVDVPMWGWGPSDRPNYLVAVFGGLSFSAGIGGEIMNGIQTARYNKIKADISSPPDEVAVYPLPESPDGTECAHNHSL
eukprot:GILK01003445.1.p1 GENE.GILK01003445.1~~GILK01003445.1.p1  ORF type:complete len:232 (-),score=3.31 GILK01003445.1:241-888(-)